MVLSGRLAATVMIALAAAGCGDAAAPEPAPAAAPPAPPAVTSAPAPAGAPAPAPGPPAVPVDPRVARYEVVKAAARAWLDRLEVDPADLDARGIAGSKKLTEALDAYLVLWEHADAETRAVLRPRVRRLAEKTNAPGYHDLDAWSDADFKRNGMSYLRAAWVLDRMGFDVGAYRVAIERARPRFDAEMAGRGGWQRFMFGRYYDHFGLERPPMLASVDLSQGLIDERRPASGFTNVQSAYELAHVVYAAYAFGYERPAAPPFDEAERVYLAEVLPILLDECIKNDFPDLMGELLSGMTYLGLRDEPAARRAIEFLLTRQNADGTWGSYEALRPRYGAYLDQQMYLHSLLVSLRALAEVFEGDWPAAPAPSS